MVNRNLIQLQMIRINRRWPVFRPDVEAIDLLQDQLYNVYPHAFVEAINNILVAPPDAPPPTIWQIGDFAQAIQNVVRPDPIVAREM